MIVVLSALLIGGMPAGLAAYLQADIRGWRPMIGFALLLLASVGLLAWAAFAVDDGTAKAFAKLDRDPRFLAGAVLFGVMVWALVGAVIGKAFERKVDPVSLGLRTTVGVSVLQFALVALGSFE